MFLFLSSSFSSWTGDGDDDVDGDDGPVGKIDSEKSALFYEIFLLTGSIMHG